MIRIRHAVADDRDRIRAWRNDPETRRASRNSAEISAPEHDAWFAAVVADPARRLYIGELDDPAGAVPIGMVRFDIGTQPDASEVSINLAPDHRGRRLSRPLLEAAIETFELERGGREALIAVIRTSNPASSRIFHSLGFDGEPGEGEVDVLVRPASQGDG